MRTRVKVCGITSVEDALSAIEAGVDALGFVFYPPSPRFIEPRKARSIVLSLPPFVVPVGVFVNEPPHKVIDIANETGLFVVQLHGDEPPDYIEKLPPLKIIKTIRVSEASELKSAQSYDVSAILLDTRVEGLWGGTGKPFDWSLASQSSKQTILAGGLNPENVATAIRIARPHAVDVSTGVEVRPGKKSPELIRAFLSAVRSIDREVQQKLLRSAIHPPTQD